MPSVMDKLKSSSTSNTAKRALTFVSSESGAITKALSAAALPRGRQQVNDIHRGSLKSICDPIFSLMMMCKEGEGGKSSNAFVRIVTGAPYPMMLLAFDCTLDDIVRFCTPVSGFNIMGIDPTFNLGAFDGTVTTYHHLLLTAHQNTVMHPVCTGPLFVHVKKDFSAYHFLHHHLLADDLPSLVSAVMGLMVKLLLLMPLLLQSFLKLSICVVFCTFATTLNVSFNSLISLHPQSRSTEETSSVIHHS